MTDTLRTARRPPTDAGAPGRADRASASGRQRPPGQGSFASRLFGYDIFLSFALGPPPRGTQSYASDLARRLRERDFAVFFSEDEAPPGAVLDDALRKALLRSKCLVVIANRHMLADPRWVRREVEEFRAHRANRPIIVINVGNALQSPEVADNAREWLGYEGKIWLDEGEEAVRGGIATEGLVTRLATAPARARSNVSWRWIVRAMVGTLVMLTLAAATGAGLAIASSREATRQRDSAEANRRRAESGEALARENERRAIEEAGRAQRAEAAALQEKSRAEASERIALSRLWRLYTDQARARWMAGNTLEAAHLAARALDLPVDAAAGSARERALLANFVTRLMDALPLRASVRTGLRVTGAVPLEGGGLIIHGADGIHRVDSSAARVRISSSSGRVEWVHGGVVAVREDSAIVFLRAATGDELRRVNGSFPYSTRSGDRALVQAGDVAQVFSIPELAPLSPAIPIPNRARAQLHLDGDYLVLPGTRLDEGSVIRRSADGYRNPVYRRELGIAQTFSRELNLVIGQITGAQGRFTIIHDLFGRAHAIPLQHGPDQSMPFDVLQGAEISVEARRIATRSRTRARLWTLEGDPVGGLLQHGDNLGGMRFLGRGRYLATWSTDRSIRLWDARTGALLRERVLDGVIMSASTTEAGDLLLVTTSSREAHVLDLTLRDVGTRLPGVQGAFFVDDGRSIASHGTSGDITWRAVRPTTHHVAIDGEHPTYAVARGAPLLGVATTDGVRLLQLPALRVLGERLLVDVGEVLSVSVDRTAMGVVEEQRVRLVAFDSAGSVFTTMDTTGLPLGQLVSERRSVSFAPRPHPRGWLVWNNESVTLVDRRRWRPMAVLRHTVLPAPLEVDRDADDAEHMRALDRTVQRIGGRLAGVELSSSGTLGFSWSGQEMVSWDVRAEVATSTARSSRSLEFACLVGGDDRSIALVEPRRVALVDARSHRLQAERQLSGRVGAVFPSEDCTSLVIVEEPAGLSGEGDARIAHVVTIRGSALTVSMIRQEEQINSAGAAGDHFHLSWGRHVFLHAAGAATPFDLEHRAEVAGATYSDDRRTLLVWDAAGELRAWDTESGWLIAAPFMFGAGLERGVIVSAGDREYVVAFGSGGRISSWLLSAPPAAAIASYTELVERATGTAAADDGAVEVTTVRR